jgi:hypothetical protein
MFGRRGKKKTIWREKSAVLKEALAFWVVAENKTKIKQYC